VLLTLKRKFSDVSHHCSTLLSATARADIIMTTPSEATARLSAAERIRLYRERRRNGMRSLWIELRVTEIEALVRIGLLKAETRNDQNAIREALYEYLDQTLGRAA
jgi:hypothetical protein